MKDIFTQPVTEEILQRINQLNPGSQPLWGSMTVSQMLAHCNVTYEMAFEDKHPQPNALLRFVLKLFVKNAVVNERPYKHNIRTAPQFIIKDTKDFAQEKGRLTEYIQKTQTLGRTHFQGKESLSFGALTSQEWNNMFYKHLDHHLRQFGV